MNKALRCLTLLASLMVAAVQAEPQRLALRSDLWCPYSCEPGAAEQGYFIDLIKAALPEARIDYAIGRWTQLRRQRSAPPQPVLVLLGVSDTEKNRSDLLLVRPAIGMALTCAFRRGDYEWFLRSPGDLRDRRLGLTLGYSYHPEVDALLADPQSRRQITQVSSERASLALARMLTMGRIDVALEDRSVMFWGLRQLETQASQSVVEAGCLPLQASDTLFFALPKSDPRAAALALALQQGLERLQLNGEMARLRLRYGLRD